MIVKLCAGLLALLVAVSACLAASKPASDDLITDQVRIKLSGDQDVGKSDIKVDVKQGVVTLTGTVDSERERGKAAKLAKKVKGVKQVVNNIALKEKITGR